MCFYSAPRHVKLTGDFVVIAALQQEVGNLLFLGLQTNRLIFHFASYPPQNPKLNAVRGRPQAPRPSTFSP